MNEVPQALNLSVVLREAAQLTGRFEAGESSGTLQGVLTGTLASGTFQATVLISTTARQGTTASACEGRGDITGTLSGLNLSWSGGTITYDNCPGLTVTSLTQAVAVSPIPAAVGSRANVVVTVRPSTVITQPSTCSSGSQGFAFTVQLAETSGVDVTFDPTFSVEERRSTGGPTVSRLDIPFTELTGGGRRVYDACSPSRGSYQAFFSGRDANGNSLRTASPVVTFGDFTVTVTPTPTATGTLTGRIANAFNGQPISGATVSVGAASATTNASGNYTMNNAPSGSQTVTTSASGFSTRTDTATIGVGGSTTFSTALVPAGGGSNVTVVLTWGEQPFDLDSHLTGPNQAGGRFHVFFLDRSPVPYATLDVDDTSSFGPETITVSSVSGSFVAGTYNYYVNNFSVSPGWNVSDAVVTLFQRGSQLAQFRVSGASGSASAPNWQVFNVTLTAAGQASIAPVQQLTSSAPMSVPLRLLRKK